MDSIKIKLGITSLTILYVLLVGLTLPKINQSLEEYIMIPQKEIKEKAIGTIIIPRIELEEDFYAIGSKENTIEKHVSILQEEKEKGKIHLLVLAAHSGTGKIAYFEELDQLQIKDEITILYDNIPYIFQVTSIWEEKKTGYIHINRETKNQLILTTCSPSKKDYQLVINCIEKES